jgi:hypothetical protein
MKGLTQINDTKTMKEKQNYISPQSEELKLQLEGVIAASGTPQWASPFDPTNNPEQTW